jgi:hypothetical protein
MVAEVEAFGNSTAGTGGGELEGVRNKPGLEGAPNRTFAVLDPSEKGLLETPARVLPLLPPMSAEPLGAVAVSTSVAERLVATPTPTDAVVTGGVEAVTFATPTDAVEATAGVSD